MRFEGILNDVELYFFYRLLSQKRVQGCERTKR